jgi:NADH:ubiquinone oxidoreductase subunit 4 (subunit M)
MILTILTFLPLAAGVLVALLGPDAAKAGAQSGLRGQSAGAGAGGGALGGLRQCARRNAIHRKRSVGAVFGIDYHLGVDGLGLLMVLLSALIVPFALLASWKIEHNPKLYFSLVLFLESGLFGVFTAQNFIHWFLFWELSLIPAFFLIKLWGGPKRTSAACQFFHLHHGRKRRHAGGFPGLVCRHDAGRTFDFAQLAEAAHGGGLFAGHKTLATAVFLGVLLGLAVKVPLVPFHTWLPAAYAEAPTGTAMLLTGAMSKMGVYGFLRILWPIFPEQMRQVAPALAGAGGGDHRFARGGRVRAEGLETHGGLFLHQPPGLLPAGHFRRRAADRRLRDFLDQ